LVTALTIGLFTILLAIFLGFAAATLRLAIALTPLMSDAGDTRASAAPRPGIDL